MGSHEYLKDAGRASEAPLPSRIATWFKRNWVVLSLVMLAIAGIALAVDNFLEPCDLEEIITYSEEIITNSNTTKTEYIRLVPLDMHVALDHSGSMRGDKFLNAKQGISALMGIIFENSTNIANGDNVYPGSKAEIRFAFSRWTNNEPATLFQLESNIQTAQGKVTDFVTNPSGGTAIGTGLAGCIETLVSEVTDAPTLPPTTSPTLSRFNGTIVTSNGSPPQPTTRSCLIVTDGVAYDNGIIFRDNISHETYQKECEDAAVLFNATNPGLLSYETSLQLKNQCGSTIDQGLQSVLTACTTLGLTGNQCTVSSIAANMRSQGIVIVGMYVGQAAQDLEFGQKFLRNLTSCAEPEFQNIIVNGDCPLFVSTGEADVVATAESLANALAGQFSSETIINEVTIQNTTTVVKPQVTYECAGDPLYFFFLIFLAPLAAYIFWRPITLLLSKYCCPPPPPVEDPEFVSLANIAPQRIIVKSEPEPIIPVVEEVLEFDDISDDESEFEDDSDSEDEDEIGDLRVAMGPDAPPNELISEKRYKWSIKASDAYMWNLGASGVAPMQVNFGAAAPPSAPKMEAKKENMRRRTQRISMRWSQKKLTEEEAAAVLAGIKERNANRQARRDAKVKAWEERKAARAVDREQRRDANRRAAVSTRISTAIHHAVVPRYVSPENRLEPFEEDEMQPGDLDYEYTMCLMRWFPCLRPNTPAPKVRKNGLRKGSPGVQQMDRNEGVLASPASLGYYANSSNGMSGSAPSSSSLATITQAQGQSGNPMFGSLDEDTEDSDSFAPMPSFRSEASAMSASQQSMQSSMSSPSAMSASQQSMNSSMSSMGNASSFAAASQPSMLSSSSSYAMSDASDSEAVVDLDDDDF